MFIYKLREGIHLKMKKIFKYNALIKILNGYLYDGLLNSNLTYFYNFGSLLGFFLIIQIVSGILLAFYYIPNIDLAFDSIEHIMREVPYGYLIRYTHANGAALFFIMVYLHIARTLIYGSYTLNSKRNFT
jgi:quinol-cytochrome oxidoreductase complex cytochrome b subunit